MKTIVSILLIIACLCLIASRLVHISTFFGIDCPDWIFVLHLGMFVILLLAIIYQNRLNLKVGRLSKPYWVFFSNMALFIYCWITILWVIVWGNQMGVPDNDNGHPVLEAHGRVIASLSEDNYRLHKAYLIRGFSCVWMGLYSYSVWSFWLALKATNRTSRNKEV